MILLGFTEDELEILDDILEDYYNEYSFDYPEDPKEKLIDRIRLDIKQSLNK